MAKLTQDELAAIRERWPSELVDGLQPTIGQAFLDLFAHISAQDEELAAARDGWTCAACGRVFRDERIIADGTVVDQELLNDQIETHIRQCEKHPLFHARKRIKDLEQQRDEAEAQLAAAREAIRQAAGRCRGYVLPPWGYDGCGSIAEELEAAMEVAK